MHLQLSLSIKQWDGPVSDYDAILVEAGRYSLARAAHVARKGWKSSAFEQNAVMGGAVRTDNYAVPGCLLDVGAMKLSLPAGAKPYQTRANELKSTGLSSPVADCFVGVLPMHAEWAGR
jgi:phytoene dehydrogenase-like protein